MARPLLLLSLFSALIATPAIANPPAPSFTMFGSVRFEDGRPLDSGEGTIIISRTSTGVEIVRGPTDTSRGQGINYALQLPMDSGTSSDLYKTSALIPDHPLDIKVVIGAKTYVPIAVAGRIVDTGEPGARERFDLVLGIDSDTDDLPDSWEQGLIESGNHPGLLTLADVMPGNDDDNDGLTNYQEFLIGTYALDASDGVFLNIVSLKGGIAHLRFVTARGRTYTVRSSVDLKTWAAQAIATDPTGANAESFYRASDSDYLDVYAPVSATEPAKFFKLYVEESP
jgi:hypothetical protein